MKKAIITGANGLVGHATARYLMSQNIEVLCLGRKTLAPEEIAARFGTGAHYIQLPMDEITALPSRIDSTGWSTGKDCVFFHFAWSGQDKLTDGSLSEQMGNAVHAAQAVQVAKKLSCTKFVNVGTLEETFAEQHLMKEPQTPFQSTQADYALAKLAARDMCKMAAYLEKIDYVHTRLSVPLDPTLSQGTYIANTLKKIAQRQTYDTPKNPQLFDIIFSDDVAKAYHQIGLKGRNKADYFVGTSRPATLSEYFEYFEQLVAGNHLESNTIFEREGHEFFSTESLRHDTGFVADTRIQDLLKQIKLS